MRVLISVALSLVLSACAESDGFEDLIDDTTEAEQLARPANKANRGAAPSMGSAMPDRMQMEGSYDCGQEIVPHLLATVEPHPDGTIVRVSAPDQGPEMDGDVTSAGRHELVERLEHTIEPPMHRDLAPSDGEPEDAMVLVGAWHMGDQALDPSSGPDVQTRTIQVEAVWDDDGKGLSGWIEECSFELRLKAVMR